MFNFDITNENTIKKSNLATNLSLFFKIIIIGGLGSGKNKCFIKFNKPSSQH